jgi:hypothetical protein
MNPIFEWCNTSWRLTDESFSPIELCGSWRVTDEGVTPFMYVVDGELLTKVLPHSNMLFSP